VFANTATVAAADDSDDSESVLHHLVTLFSAMVKRFLDVFFMIKSENTLVFWKLTALNQNARKHKCNSARKR
jgi:hypothetical protein